MIKGALKLICGEKTLMVLPNFDLVSKILNLTGKIRLVIQYLQAYYGVIKHFLIKLNTCSSEWSFMFFLCLIQGSTW